jgi:hypothetical protein
MRRGLTYLDRQKLRRLVYAREVDKARQRAMAWKLSPQCRGALALMATEPGLASGMHQECKQEEIGGKGCLCTCHDVVSGGVSAGFAV